MVARRAPGGELRKDAPHDRRLGLVDQAAAMDRLATGVELALHVVAIAEAATGAALRARGPPGPGGPSGRGP